MSIFKVLSNLKYNGQAISAGQFVEAELTAFESLIEDGIVKLFADARSIEHAMELDAADAAEADAAKEAEVAAAPQDTWAPKKDEEKTVEAAPVDATPAAPAATEEKKEGFLAGMFGKKEDAPAAPAPAASTDAPVAPAPTDPALDANL